MSIYKTRTFFKIQRLLPTLVTFFDKLNVNSLKRVSLSCKIVLLVLNLFQYLRQIFDQLVSPKLVFKEFIQNR